MVVVGCGRGSIVGDVAMAEAPHVAGAELINFLKGVEPAVGGG